MNKIEELKMALAILLAASLEVDENPTFEASYALSEAQAHAANLLEIV